MRTQTQSRPTGSLWRRCRCLQAAGEGSVVSGWLWNTAHTTGCFSPPPREPVPSWGRWPGRGHALVDPHLVTGAPSSRNHSPPSSPLCTAWLSFPSLTCQPAPDLGSLSSPRLPFFPCSADHLHLKPPLLSVFFFVTLKSCWGQAAGSAPDPLPPPPAQPTALSSLITFIR